jgi:hypothetical protein
MRFYFLMPMNMQIAVFWDVPPSDVAHDNLHGMPAYCHIDKQQARRPKYFARFQKVSTDIPAGFC